MNKLVILDRDGVINKDSPDYIKSPAEWQPIPGSLEAIVKLNKAGYHVAIATNQSGIGRGLYSLETLTQIHQKMHDALSAIDSMGHIDAIFFCPHTPEENCDCRKPKSGLIHQALNYFQIKTDLSQILAIGDSLRDLEAAKSAGCTPILVLTGNGEKTRPKLSADLQHTPIYADLRAAATAIIQQDPLLKRAFP